MPEQPWRNPRRAPQMSEVQPRLGKMLAPQWVRVWWPALLWAVLIFALSTDSFSSDHTASIFWPICRWLDPSMTVEQFGVVHHYIRKSAHFTEYFIFCVLLYRGIRAGRTGWRWSWALAGLSIAAGYSVLDEVHQAFVASRTASPYDSLLDSVGAFVAVVAMWLWFRMRRDRQGVPGEAESEVEAVAGRQA